MAQSRNLVLIVISLENPVFRQFLIPQTPFVTLYFTITGDGIPSGRVVENAAALAMLRDPNSIEEDQGTIHK